MALTADQIYQALNEAAQSAGFFATSNEPATISDDTIESIGVMPASAINSLLGEYNNIMTAKWVDNGLSRTDNPVAPFVYDDTAENGFGFVQRMNTLLPARTEPESAADTAADLVGFTDPPIKRQFFTKSFDKSFKLTLDNREMRKFLTPSGIRAYTDLLYSSLYSSAEKFILDSVLTAVQEGFAGAENERVSPSVTDESGAAKYVLNIKKVSKSFEGYGTTYNLSGIESRTRYEDQVLLMTGLMAATLDIYLRRNTKNLEFIEIPNTVVIPNVSTILTLTDMSMPAQALLIDRRAIQCSIKHYSVDSFKPANKNWTNTFLLMDGIIGTSELLNACAFVSFTE